MPLRQRLMAIMLLTSGTVLTLTCASFLAYDMVAFRKAVTRNLATIASIVADNSTAVLAFDDPSGLRRMFQHDDRDDMIKRDIRKGQLLETSDDIQLRIIPRWIALCESSEERAFAREFLHPDSGAMTVDRQVHLYGWHSRHHVAHIDALRQQKGW